MTGPDQIRVEMAGRGDASAWDSFVDRNEKSSIYHRWAWQEVIRGVFGRRTYYLMAKSGTEVQGLLPLVRLKSLVFGDFLVSMPFVNYGGILADRDSTWKALASEARSLAEQMNCDHVELRHVERTLEWPSRTDKVSMQLDLPENADALWRELGSKRRSQINRPKREGVEHVVGGVELVGDFYSVFSKKYRDLGVPVYPQTWFEVLLTRFSDSASVFVARINGEAVAASIVIGFRNTLEVPWAASVRAADRFGVNMYLYWSMLAYAIERGYKVFDFGRSTEGSGTYRFKSQWGAKPLQLYWSYWLNGGEELPRLNAANPKYRMAVAVWRRLPLVLANHLGPMIVKNLP